MAEKQTPEQQAAAEVEVDHPAPTSSDSATPTEEATASVACEPESAADNAAAKALAALQAELDGALDEAASLKDQLLRAAADVQNARRRAEQDVEKAHKFGVEKLINELLPIIDSLERALEACKGDDEATKALRDGVEMTYSMFLTSVAKFGVEQVNPQGEAFNPELHQAMSMVDAPDAAANSVVAVVQKGYSLNGRLVRPAMVMVAKS